MFFHQSKLGKSGNFNGDKENEIGQRRVRLLLMMLIGNEGR